MTQNRSAQQSLSPERERYWENQLKEELLKDELFMKDQLNWLDWVRDRLPNADHWKIEYENQRQFINQLRSLEKGVFTKRMRALHGE